MRHRVAQHVLQRRGHAVEDVAVHFAAGAVDLQLHLLAGIDRGLAQHAAQARHQRVEGHHARAHEAFLQVGADARLLQQQGFVLAGQVVEHALQVDQVVRGFVERAGQLLLVGEAVELERIEALVVGLALALVARDDLRLGLDVEAAQLLAQSRRGLVEFAEVGAERTQLLFQAGAVDGDFAGVVDQAVEQVGADAHLFLRRADAGHLFLAASVFHRRGQRHVAGAAAFGARRGCGGGCVDAVAGGFGVGAGTRVERLAFRQRFDLGDQPGRQRDRLALADAGDHAVQAVEAALEHDDAGRRRACGGLRRPTSSSDSIAWPRSPTA